MIPRDDIIRMAEKAEILEWCEGETDEFVGGLIMCLQDFAALVAAAERENCAEILDANAEACVMNSTVQQVLRSNAKAIRARGQS